MHPSPRNDPARPDLDAGPSVGSQRWLSLGVLAHVDAGKTSLTEALLHAGGALSQRGRVDDGTTQTDTMAMERRRGITIRTAVATFSIGDVTVNLVDTPGHPDFIAEVDRSLAVLDGAILVLSAVEGVQAQTIVLYRALRRLQVPVLFMINKIDRSGANPEHVLAAIRRRLTASLLPLGSVTDPGKVTAAYRPASWQDPAVKESITAGLADHDDELLQTWADGGSITPDLLWDRLGQLTRRGQIHPVLSGSAVTGAGVSEVVEVATALLPGEPADPGALVIGHVFTIDRSQGERVCLVRLRRGTLSVRDRVHLGRDRSGTISMLEIYEPGGAVGRDRVLPGQIARVHGLSEARIGDRIGSSAQDRVEPTFSAPALETVVIARDPDQQIALRGALNELADVDPLIGVRTDERQGAVRITVYGEVQQQVIAETLDAEHGIDVEFRATVVRCIERPAGRGEAVLRSGEPGHLFEATLGVMVEPIEPGAGVELVIAAPRQTIPLHVYSTLSEFESAMGGYLQPALAEGPHGWPVTDIRVTVTESDYNAPGPPAGHVRHTTERVVREAIQVAGTVVCDPIERFIIEAPVQSTSSVLGLLSRHRAVPEDTQPGQAIVTITGTLPTAEVDAVRRGLHSASHGEGIIEAHLDHYSPMRGRANPR